MKVKVSKYNLNIHYRGSPGREEVELSNTRTAYVMHIPNTLSLTSVRNNSKQKFQLHFSSVNLILIILLHMLFFYGGHLVMRSKRCAVQNRRITLSPLRRDCALKRVLIKHQNASIFMLYWSQTWPPCYVAATKNLQCRDVTRVEKKVFLNVSRRKTCLAFSIFSLF